MILDTRDGHEKGEESDLSSEQMPKSPRMAGTNGEPCLFVSWKRPWDVNEDNGTHPSLTESDLYFA